ncbi:MAG: O-acyl transferase, partial [Limisphaerales bacterium]
MIFTQPIFLLFFAVCFLVHWALKNHQAQKWWLLACSYYFYGYWDW